MKITEVRLKKMSGHGRMKAIASITFDDSFVVRGIRVIEGDKGFFVAMPSRRTADGNFRDIAHPIKTETREEVEELVLKEYFNNEQEPDNKKEEHVDDEHEDEDTMNSTKN